MLSALVGNPVTSLIGMVCLHHLQSSHTADRSGCGAGDTLRLNLTALGPLVLPIWEQVRFGINHVGRKVIEAVDHKATRQASAKSFIVMQLHDRC